MIIGNLDPLRSLVSPNKAHAELIVDPYAVLPPAIAFQSLQLVPRRNTQ
jgi:hypothetical protein